MPVLGYALAAYPVSSAPARTFLQACDRGQASDLGLVDRGQASDLGLARAALASVAPAKSLNQNRDCMTCRVLQH